jgi:hypothetical protein
VAESYLRLRFRAEVRRADGRLPRLAFFPFDDPPRFAAALRPPPAFVTWRAVFAARFVERDALVFFADVFLRLLPLFFAAGFRMAFFGFGAAAFFAGRLPSDDADVAFRIEPAVDLDAGAAGVTTVEISRDGVVAAGV